MYNLLCVLLKINRQSITCLFCRSIHNFPVEAETLAPGRSERVDDSHQGVPETWKQTLRQTDLGGDPHPAPSLPALRRHLLPGQITVLP